MQVSDLVIDVGLSKIPAAFISPLNSLYLFYILDIEYKIDLVKIYADFSSAFKTKS